MSKKTNKKSLDNFKKFLEERPRNYQNAGRWGKFYMEINDLGWKPFAFPVRKGAIIHDGDLIMLDWACNAYPANIYSTLADDEKHESECVGIAYGSFHKDDDDTCIVLVKHCSVLRMKNSADLQYRISEEDVSSSCYLEEDGTVSTNSEKGFLGQIMGIENGDILVFVNLMWEE